MSSALSGIGSAQDMFDGAAQAVSRAAEPGVDLTEGIVGTTVASEAFDLNVAVLRKALDTERYLVDLLA